MTELDPARIEAVARQLCRMNNFDPDREWFMFPRDYQTALIGGQQGVYPGVGHSGPAWHLFTSLARDVLEAIAEIDSK